MPSYKDLGLPSMAEYDMARKEQEASDQHKKAMDYIYNRIIDSDEPGVHEAFDQEYNDEEETQCQKCKRGVNLYYEAIFVVGIYVNDVREAQEFWCKQCAVKGMKGDLT